MRPGAAERVILNICGRTPRYRSRLVGSVRQKNSVHARDGFAHVFLARAITKQLVSIRYERYSHSSATTRSGFARWVSPPPSLAPRPRSPPAWSRAKMKLYTRSSAENFISHGISLSGGGQRSFLEITARRRIAFACNFRVR